MPSLHHYAQVKKVSLKFIFQFLCRMSLGNAAINTCFYMYYVALIICRYDCLLLLRESHNHNHCICFVLKYMGNFLPPNQILFVWKGCWQNPVTSCQKGLTTHPSVYDVTSFPAITLLLLCSEIFFTCIVLCIHRFACLCWITGLKPKSSMS